MADHNWLIFFHTLPAKPVAARMRIWRRLSKSGALHLKGSVYLLPYSHERRELLAWLAQEIETLGGEADFVTVERTIGRKHIVPYALYRGEGYVSAPLAEKTGFTQEDLDLLWEAMTNMFEHDRSAARGKMAARRLYVFKHEGKLGNAPAHKLFDLISVERAKGASGPARSFGDYAISVARDQMPVGVTLEEML